MSAGEKFLDKFAPPEGDTGDALRAAERALKTPPGENEAYRVGANASLIGRSPRMQQLLSLMARIAATDSSVLITGSTGTGKELVARAIHNWSRRASAPFIDINCSAIPDTLVEAELFGHQRGTFTDAHETRRGLFEGASGGTIFLDEVDALALPAQAKLLRVLQERHLRRIGGRVNIPISVRVISATNRDIKRAVAEGAFRSDLFFRLSVIPLHVPELRERGGEDIKLLVNHFLRRAQRDDARRRKFSAEAMRALLSYHWPGNVRELENAVEYALAIGEADEIGVGDLPPDVLREEPGGDTIPRALKECWQGGATLAEIERLYILSVLERCEGNQAKAASLLDIDRRTLYRKLKDYGAFAAPPRNTF
ncbi:MAG TPA: sigma-54 dependent transcriptional regulator [Pyrinomonadaceae bacterium]|jgi:DNA-binding NtrC family response regulator